MNHLALNPEVLEGKPNVFGFRHDLVAPVFDMSENRLPTSVKLQRFDLLDEVLVFLQVIIIGSNM
jgi:hypothetical protein